jgi:outer membrane protein
MLGLSSLAFSARKLTTPQIRRNTIRINALEIEKIDITEIIEDPKQEGPKDVIVVMDERSLLFDFDKSNVKPQYYEMLHKFIEYVNYNNYNVVIEGHTDSKGTNEYNMKLGMRRAVSVRDKLLEFGMDPSRIVGVTSKGEEQPVALNSTDEGRALNRRIEFILSKQD